MLTVHNFSKSFGDKKAVDAISFSVKEGEIFSLIGPNSSGKTTIIKSIVGLLAPTSGSITINGHDSVSQALLAKACVGYIPDEPSVWPYMTGEEFLYFTQALFCVPENRRKKTISQLLDTFNLSQLEKQTFDEYSRGNKQKFSIISAMSHEPKLLLVDEPIVGLDPTGAEIAKNLFVSYAKNGGAVLLVTHTLSVAEEISDRIGFLKDGKLICVGTLDELRKKANLEATSSLVDIYKALV